MLPNNINPERQILPKPPALTPAPQLIDMHKWSTIHDAPLSLFPQTASSFAANKVGPFQGTGLQYNSSSNLAVESPDCEIISNLSFDSTRTLPNNFYTASQIPPSQHPRAMRQLHNYSMHSQTTPIVCSRESQSSASSQLLNTIQLGGTYITFVPPTTSPLAYPLNCSSKTPQIVVRPGHLPNLSGRSAQSITFIIDSNVASSSDFQSTEPLISHPPSLACSGLSPREQSRSRTSTLILSNILNETTSACAALNICSKAYQPVLPVNCQRRGDTSTTAMIRKDIYNLMHSKGAENGTQARANNYGSCPYTGLTFTLSVPKPSIAPPPVGHSPYPVFPPAPASTLVGTDPARLQSRSFPSPEVTSLLSNGARHPSEAGPSSLSSALPVGETHQGHPVQPTAAVCRTAARSGATGARRPAESEAKARRSRVVALPGPSAASEEPAAMQGLSVEHAYTLNLPITIPRRPNQLVEPAANSPLRPSALMLVNIGRNLVRQQYSHFVGPHVTLRGIKRPVSSEPSVASSLQTNQSLDLLSIRHLVWREKRLPNPFYDCCLREGCPFRADSLLGLSHHMETGHQLLVHRTDGLRCFLQTAASTTADLLAVRAVPILHSTYECPDAKYMCPNCQKTFASARRFQMHMSRVHNIASFMVSEGLSLMTCWNCGASTDRNQRIPVCKVNLEEPRQGILDHLAADPARAISAHCLAALMLCPSPLAFFRLLPSASASTTGEASANLVHVDSIQPVAASYSLRYIRTISSLYGALRAIATRNRSRNLPKFSLDPETAVQLKLLIEESKNSSSQPSVMPPLQLASAPISQVRLQPAPLPPAVASTPVRSPDRLVCDEVLRPETEEDHKGPSIRNASYSEPALRFTQLNRLLKEPSTILQTSPATKRRRLLQETCERVVSGLQSNPAHSHMGGGGGGRQDILVCPMCAFSSASRVEIMRHVTDAH